MTDQEIISYHAAMAIGHALLRKKLIRKDEFLRFEKKMMKKYRLPENSIFRDYMIVYPPCFWDVLGAERK